MQKEMAKAILTECEKWTEKSTCNKRHIGSALVFPDGIAYFATNGSMSNPCTEKGKAYCTREGDGFKEMPEYFTCPSPCAEGSTIISALKDGRKERNGAIVSTDFPCERCTNLLIDSGIVSELYFSGFKDNKLRGRDYVYQIWMAREGISMNIVIGDKIFNYDNRDILDELGSFLYSIRTPGSDYLPTIDIDRIPVKPVKLLWTPKNEFITIS